MTKHITTLLIMMLYLTGFAQEDLPKVQTKEYKVSAVCGMCKKRIEKELNYTKGVVFAEVDLEEGHVLVKYKTKQLKGDDVLNILLNLGYSVDGKPANKEAYEALPKCCKDEGCGKLE